MKRLIPASVLLMLIIIIGFASSFTVLKAIKSFNSEIVRCEALYSSGGNAAALKCAEEFEKHWHSSATHISAYTNHRPLDDIGMLASMLPEAVRTKNDFEFASITHRIKTELRIIYKEQSLNLESFY